MIYKTPRRLPSLADMIRDLNASPSDIAQVLDVSPSSVYRWMALGQGPRPAALTLFWLTSWGQDELNAEQHDRANVYQRLAQALQRQVDQLETEVWRLSQIGHYGSANDPLPRAPARFGLDDAATIAARRPRQPRGNSQDAPTVTVYQVRR